MPKFWFKFTKSEGIPIHWRNFLYFKTSRLDLKEENYGIEDILTIPKRKIFTRVDTIQYNIQTLIDTP